MATKLIIREGYLGDPIGETIMNNDLTVNDILDTLCNHLMLSLNDEEQLKYLEDAIIIDNEIIFYVRIEIYNRFECFCIVDKLCDEFADLGKKYNKKVIVNDYKNRSEDDVFLEVDEAVPHCSLHIPIEKEKKLGELFEIALLVNGIICEVVKKVLRFSKNVKPYPRPERLYTPVRTKLFISHSSKDKLIVKKIVSDLKSKNFDVWYDEENIIVGQDFVEQIENGIRESDFLVLVMSKNFIDHSPWAKQEYRIALTDQISKNITKILPLLIEDCNIPDFLKTKHYADFREDYDYGLNKLINSANKLLRR